jgi:diguanylate cyclase (GGDEF)-like protein
MDAMLKKLFCNLHDLNLPCREYFLKSDTDLTAIALGLTTILLPLMNYLDYQYYGFSLSYISTSIFEAVFVAVSILAIVFTQRNQLIKTYETWVFGWSMFTAFSLVILIFTQPDRILENILFSQLFLIAIYTLLTNRLVFKLIPVLTITGFCLVALFTSSYTNFANQYMFTIALLTVNAGGILLVAHNNRAKKLIYETQNREHEARNLLETLAITDPLTGIQNRRSFFEQAQQEFSRYQRNHKSFCLVMLDLDHFKDVNDGYGHLAGDEALKEFTTYVISAKRPYDFLGRVGGEEFCLILPETNLDTARLIVTRIQDRVRELVIICPKGIIKVAFSAGITCAHESDESIDVLLHRADEALYQAKTNGRDRIELSI